VVVTTTSLPIHNVCYLSKLSGLFKILFFQVPRDFSAFEKLQKDILLAFPQLKLPNLPRKFLMFVGEADIEERMVSFDCIVKIIARSKEMCTSPPMLEFLGFDLLADRKYHKVTVEMHGPAMASLVG